MPNSAHSSWNLSSSGERWGMGTAGLYLGTTGNAIKDKSLRRFGHLDCGQLDAAGVQIGLLGEPGAEARRQVRLDELGHFPDHREGGAALDDRRDRLGPEVGVEQESHPHARPGAD